MPLTTTIQSLTQDYIIPAVIDNVYENSPVLVRLKQKQQVILDGSERIQQPIRYQKIGASGY